MFTATQVVLGWAICWGLDPSPYRRWPTEMESRRPLRERKPTVTVAVPVQGEDPSHHMLYAGALFEETLYTALLRVSRSPRACMCNRCGQGKRQSVLSQSTLSSTEYRYMPTLARLTHDGVHPDIQDNCSFNRNKPDGLAWVVAKVKSLILGASAAVSRFKHGTLI
ncbi:hypothetical protein BKA67DRAFT_170329 [Truncatella angustata]|uniref:Cryptic loci regulator 2 N-terminal domain-containing protein n=1 Tax=Truncatella angustata TaxID=152316 RepID=A0A9P9A090_9PEZI|nr:uncharacterized protein BKA67DRAFT_170329 [Truncatella angustata]KAH6656824.1 hypothetical protein BKA67DRAFT_170329 [Truncatella angustata]